MGFGTAPAKACHMRNSCRLLILCAAFPLLAQEAAQIDPGQVLFDLGSKSEAAGQLERAKVIFQTLAATYNEHPNTVKAKTELGAICLLMEAQSQTEAGKTQTAYTTFRTLMRVYPESPLAKLADASAKSLGIPPDPRR
jgi:outer membrane protein assembly factor BamD (BamD/ComL family)